jgi:hypothetical protein
MKQKLTEVGKSFSLELPLYAVLVAGYAFLIVHFLGDWIFRLFKTERIFYAVVALGLIIGQGFFLEVVARALYELVNRRKKK